MASIITATVASGLTQSADNSGVLQLASGTGNLVTIPAVTGTAMVSGNMPLFRAVPASTQTINHDATTKVTWGTETYDTNNNFASSRFTPTVAGYYQINAVIDFGITNARNYYFQNMIYKNGSAFSNPEWYATGNAGGRTTTAWSDIVYCNGSTDYIEIYVYAYDYTASTSVTVRTESSFSGSLVRAA